MFFAHFLHNITQKREWEEVDSKNNNYGYAMSKFNHLINVFDKNAPYWCISYKRVQSDGYTVYLLVKLKLRFTFANFCLCILISYL